MMDTDRAKTILEALLRRPEIERIQNDDGIWLTREQALEFLRQFIERAGLRAAMGRRAQFVRPCARCGEDYVFNLGGKGPDPKWCPDCIGERREEYEPTFRARLSEGFRMLRAGGACE